MRQRVGERKARVVYCCLTLSPSPVKWLKNYLSHKSDEARVAWVFELTQGPLCSDLCQAGTTKHQWFSVFVNKIQRSQPPFSFS